MRLVVAYATIMRAFETAYAAILEAPGFSVARSFRYAPFPPHPHFLCAGNASRFLYRAQKNACLPQVGRIQPEHYTKFLAPPALL
jgi:hypothetical protein